MAPGATPDPFPQFTSQVGGTPLRAKVWGEFACSRIWMESRVSLQLWFFELDPMAVFTHFSSPFRVNCSRQWHVGTPAVSIMAPGLLNTMWSLVFRAFFLVLLNLFTFLLTWDLCSCQL